MKLLVTGGAGFIGSTYVRQHLAENPTTRSSSSTSSPTPGGMENLAASTRTASSFVEGDIADPEAVARGHRRLRRGRQLRRRVARRPLDRGSRRVHPDRRLRHLRPARGRARRRHPAPADLDRRGLRLDRRGLVHRELADRALVALLGVEGRRRHARRRLPAHLRRRRADRPRLEQLRPPPAPREADPAMILNAMAGDRLPVYGDGMQVRNWLFTEDFASAIDVVLAKGEPGEVYNVGGPEELPNIEVDQDDPRAHRPRRVADRLRRGPARPRPPLLAVGRADRGPRLEGRGRTSRRGSGGPSSGTATTRNGGGRSAPASTASTTSASTARSWVPNADRRSRPPSTAWSRSSRRSSATSAASCSRAS